MLQSSSGGGVLPAGGVCLVSGGLPGPGGFLPDPGGSAWSGGGLPGPREGLPGPGGSPEKPVNRITHTCKNITLATTSLWPVIIFILMRNQCSTYRVLCKRLHSHQKRCKMCLHLVWLNFPTSQPTHRNSQLTKTTM